MIKKQKFVILAVLFLVAAGCNPFASAPSGGIIKTDNGGADWQFHNKAKDENSLGLASAAIATLRIDPRNPDHLFAASFSGGLYKSEDSGESWQLILSRIAVYDVIVHPNDSAIIFASGNFSNHGKILVTRDGGKSWVEVYNEGSLNNPVRALAINPNRPDEMIAGLQAGGSIKSIDGGKSWTAFHDFNDRINRMIWQPAALYVVTQTSGVFKTVNTETAFENITASLFPQQSTFGVTISRPRISEISQLAVNTTNSGLLYLTTDGGLYKTSDEGKNWNFVTVPLDDQNRSIQFRAIALYPPNPDIVYTSAGNTIYKSNNGGATWQTSSVATSGSINYIVINPTTPQVAYAGIFVEN